MAKRWLTEALDRTDFNTEGIEQISSNLKKIEFQRKQLNGYFSTHPQAYQKIVVNDNERFLRCAISFLGLEDHNDVIGITPVSQQNENQKEEEAENIRKIRAYSDACTYIHRCALNLEKGMENCGIEANMLIKAHSILCSYDGESYRKNARSRFRNEDDGLIIIGRGIFNPVPGDLVQPRIDRLFLMYNNDWYNENTLVKGVKFMLEYIRIQPHLDGNKRVGLMALNFILEKDGFPAIYLSNKEYDEFVSLVEDCIVSRNITPLVGLVSKYVTKAQNSYYDEILLYRINKKINRLEGKNEPFEDTSLNHNNEGPEME